MTEADVWGRIAGRLRRLFAPRPSSWRGFLAHVSSTTRRKVLSDGEVRVYTSYRMTVPREVAEELGEAMEDSSLLVLAAPARWWHLLDYSDPANLETWRRLPEPARAENCLAGNGPGEECERLGFLVVYADRGELEELGLEPGTTVSLRELRERLGAQPRRVEAAGRREA